MKEDKACKECTVGFVNKSFPTMSGRYCSIFEAQLVYKCPCKLCLVKAMCENSCKERIVLRLRSHVKIYKIPEEYNVKYNKGNTL